MPDQPPILSVVTPVLNGGAMFADCIESVDRSAVLAARRGLRIEHIIADGGSADGSLELAGRAAHRPGSCIARVLEGPDAGQADAINRGVRASRGMYVAWLNADDLYRPTELVDLISAAQVSEADAVFGRCRFLDRAGTEIFRPTPPEPVTACALATLISGWFAGCSLVQPEVLVARCAWDRAGGLNPANHHTMDHELWLRLALLGSRFEGHDLLVAEQRVHTAQKTADNEAVVRSMLEHCRAASEDCPRAAHELRVIERRLGALERVRSRSAGLRRVAPSYLAVPRDPAMVRRLLRVSGPGEPATHGTVCFIDCDELASRWKRRDRIRFADRLPQLPASARLVVAHAPTFRYGAGALRRLVSWLVRGGVLIAFAEPDPAGSRAALAVLAKQLRDALTLPEGASPLDGDLGVLAAQWSLLADGSSAASDLDGVRLRAEPERSRVPGIRTLHARRL